MRGLVDQRHERIEFVGPIIEQVIGVFGSLKVNDAGQSVHLGIDGFVYNKAGEELLRFLVEQIINGKLKKILVLHYYLCVSYSFNKY